MKHKYVSFYKGKWVGGFTYRGRYIYIGRYHTEMEAVTATDDKLYSMQMPMHLMNYPNKYSVLEKVRCVKCDQIRDRDDFITKTRGTYKSKSRVKLNKICKTCRLSSIAREAIYRKEHSHSAADLIRIKNRNILSNLRYKLAAIRGRSNKRKITMTLSAEYVMSIWNSQDGKCAICGGDVDWINGIGHNPYGLSIDRINNDEDYIAGNVRITHSLCNRMRGILSHDNFVAQCKKIIAYNT